MSPDPPTVTEPGSVVELVTVVNMEAEAGTVVRFVMDAVEVVEPGTVVESSSVEGELAVAGPGAVSLLVHKVILTHFDSIALAISTQD